MKMKTHVKISRDIHGYIEQKIGSQLSPFLFALGNILPDLAIHLRIKSHTKHRSLNYLLRRIRSLRRNRHRSKLYISLKLGIITHFISDFFCYPHTEKYDGTLNEHRLYEKSLARYAKQRDSLMPNHLIIYPVLQDFESAINELYKKYLQIEQSFENDIRYALHTARSVTLALAPEMVPDLLTELAPVTIYESA